MVCHFKQKTWQQPKSSHPAAEHLLSAHQPFKIKPFTATRLGPAGSMLEGGGQILRNAAALAAITTAPIKVSKIRAGRGKPGLRAQHLAGLQLVADLCQGSLHGATIGSQEISLIPHHLNSGHHIADTKTAGSCMLLAQVQGTHTHMHSSPADVS